MSKRLRYAVAIGAAAALATSVLTNAWASGNSHLRANASKNFTVTGVLHVNKNASFYGHTYAHNQLQVWNGETIHTGGLKVVSGGIDADAVTVNGPLKAQSGDFGTGVVTAGTLQATTISGGSLTGTSLSVTGNGTFTGTGNFAGKLTASGGLDAGAQAITTTGQVAAGQLTTGTLQAGTLTAGSITATPGGTTTLSGNFAFGTGATVDFSHATVTGLTTASSAPTLVVGNSSATSPPLTITQSTGSVALGAGPNGLTITQGANTAAVGANATGLVVSGLSDSGPLSVTGNASVGGNLTVSGSAGVTATSVTAPSSGTPAVQGPLTLSGNGITLSGNTTASGDLTIAGANNLKLTTTGGGSPSAGHLLVGADTDVAGRVSVAIDVAHQVAGTEARSCVDFTKPYTGTPYITLTPSQNTPPDPWGSGAAPEVWTSLNGSPCPTTTAATTGPYVGFTVHYIAPMNGGTPTTTYVANFDYHVIGSS